MSAPILLSSKDTAAVSSTCGTYNMTPAEFDALRTAAVSAKALAYCPYSKFRVGAALLPLTTDGTAAVPPQVITGVNVENASYPVGTCAERVAIGNAVAAGVMQFRAIAVATDISPPASPCGMCRQFIREFCNLEMPIIMFDKNEDYAVLTVNQVLPMSFGPDALPPPGAPGM